MGEGGRGSFGCDGSTNANSEGNSSCWLDDVSEDSEVKDVSEEESLSKSVIVERVIVSVLERGTKRPWTLGCVFQASVTKWCVVGVK